MWHTNDLWLHYYCINTPQQGLTWSTQGLMEIDNTQIGLWLEYCLDRTSLQMSPVPDHTSNIYIYLSSNVQRSSCNNKKSNLRQQHFYLVLCDMGTIMIPPVIVITYPCMVWNFFIIDFVKFWIYWPLYIGPFYSHSVGFLTIKSTNNWNGFRFNK